MKNALKISLLFALFCVCRPAQAQQWRLHINGNETYPFNNELQGYYPILWYSSDEGRGILIGGFGGGVSYTTRERSHYALRYQFNAQRSRFYEEPAIINDENGQPLIGAIGINTNLNAAFLAMPQLRFNEHLSVGIGLGIRYTAYSTIYYGNYEENGKKKKLSVANESMSPLVGVVPLELTASAGRFSLGLRAEPALNNVSRLSANAGDRTTVLFVELSYLLKQNTGKSAGN
ncbi:MAG: hypothetical protein R2824_35625 [Saprospiraceae bacterium]|nr:hypothetical protein [Lewinella sp.]